MPILGVKDRCDELLIACVPPADSNECQHIEELSVVVQDESGHQNWDSRRPVMWAEDEDPVR